MPPSALSPGRLDPKLDVVFKLLLTRWQVLLLDMLQAILARPIERLTILNPEILGELASDKEIVLDIRVALHDGSRVDVEMQVRAAPALGSRLVYYAARDYADQLDRGEGYDALTPTLVIVWLVEALPGLPDRLHTVYELRERHTNERFGEQLAIHVLQLSALSPSGAIGYAAQVERWARFLVARDDAEYEQLASEDSIMTIARQALDELSQDPATRRLARERADAIKLYQIDLAAWRADAEAKGRAEGMAKGMAEGMVKGMAEGMAEGMAKGRAEGEAKLLLRQLGLRFGPLSDATRARVETATLEQLDAWGERILTARTLDEVLAT